MEIIYGVSMFILIITLLVMIILFAKNLLIPSGDIEINVNNDKDKSFKASPGSKLLSILSDKDIFLSSACGGGGSCGQCKVKILNGGGQILPTELEHISRKEAKCGERLACQVNVKSDLVISTEAPQHTFSEH